MEWLELAFMQRALLAALITGITAPAIGSYLVQRRLSLLGDGLGHLAVAGVGLAYKLADALLMRRPLEGQPVENWLDLVALGSDLPTSIALMTGVAGMLVCGVLKMDEAYSAISWKTVFLMACLIPLGWAMDTSGAAAWIAGHTIEELPEGLPVWVIQFTVAALTSVGL